jgi:hypothetical protein
MGIPAPDGTPLSVKVPSAADKVTAAGFPAGGVLQGMHVGPWGMASSVVVGT